MRLNYEELKTYRLRLMEDVRRMVESGEARTPQQLSERLKTLKLPTDQRGHIEDMLAAYDRRRDRDFPVPCFVAL